MDNLYCDGKEKSLSDCRFDGWGQSDCVPEEAAGVVCSSSKEEDDAPEELRINLPKIPKVKIRESDGGDKIKVRLRGGNVIQEGRVEV